jgi:hypothetical protein
MPGIPFFDRINPGYKDGWHKNKELVLSINSYEKALQSKNTSCG